MNVNLFNFYDVYFAIIEDNIFKKKRCIHLVTVDELTFQNCEETKELQAIKHYDQRTRSKRQFVGEFQLICGIFRQDITVFAKSVPKKGNILCNSLLRIKDSSLNYKFS